MGPRVRRDLPRARRTAVRAAAQRPLRAAQDVGVRGEGAGHGSWADALDSVRRTADRLETSRTGLGPLPDAGLPGQRRLRARPDALRQRLRAPRVGGRARGLPRLRRQDRRADADEPHRGRPRGARPAPPRGRPPRLPSRRVARKWRRGAGRPAAAGRGPRPVPRDPVQQHGGRRGGPTSPGSRHVSCYATAGCPARRSRTTVVRSPCSSPGRTPWCRRGSAKRSSTDTGGRSDSGCNPTAATTRSTSTPRRHCGARCRHFSRTLNRTSRCSASALPSDLETGPAVCGSAT